MHEAVADILDFLTRHFDEDFHSYSKKLAEKKILERATQLSLCAASDYRRFLGTDPHEPALLARLLRVRFSTFFRDPLQFHILGSVLIPELLYDRHKGLFRVWSAACAGGEEAYSLAIILQEAVQRLAISPLVQIFGTDIADDALEEARLGWYLPDRLGEVTLKRIGEHFENAPPGYQVAAPLRSMITWSRHDLLSDRTYAPPESLFGAFDLVLCRNFLMYLDPPAYDRVFDKLFRALNPGGILMLGRTETVPERYLPHLERTVDCGNMYRKSSVREVE